MLQLRKNKKYQIGLAAVIAIIAIVAVVAVAVTKNKSMTTAGGVKVKAMQLQKQDVNINYDYTGQIVGKDDVKIQPKVSGKVVEKYINGGDIVEEGQLLYRIDSRQYESDVLSAQADLADAEATLNNAQVDLVRDQNLLASEATSEQTVTTQQSKVQSYQATAASKLALVRKAEQNLEDTYVYSPIYGKLGVDDVSTGTYASAGSTTLVTVGSVRQVFAQFNINEKEYLNFAQAAGDNSNVVTAHLTLSNGTDYPIDGVIAQTDRSVSASTGTMTIKALFDNPQIILLPGMFVRVSLSGNAQHDVILVPQRAVQQLLDKTFVMLVGADNKSVARNITIGDSVGSYYIVKSGLDDKDTVVVEGLTNLEEGKALEVQHVTADEMGFTLDSAQQE
jgi:membrane fusion protein (multidrug efflux system)